MKKTGLLFITIAFAACTKVLDQVPEYTIAEDNFWQTANDAESAAIGIYPAAQMMRSSSP
jgi:hypothetical protein